MGFFFGSVLKGEPVGNLGPTITPGEYISTLSSVIRTIPRTLEQRRLCYQLGIRYLTMGLPGLAVRIFSGLVRLQPNDQQAHRLLGFALLRQGDLRRAAEHLGTALELLRRQAVGALTLYNSLRLECEAAQLRLVLVPLHMRLGQVEAARSLIMKGKAL